MTAWIKKDRCRLWTVALLINFGQKLQGHFNYYGVSGNAEMLKRFFRQSYRIVFMWLNRRTQKKSCNWTGLSEMLAHFRIPRPKLSAIGNKLALVRSEQY
jgi:RNA-directed DNA polymerase